MGKVATPQIGRVANIPQINSRRCGDIITVTLGQVVQRGLALGGEIDDVPRTRRQGVGLMGAQLRHIRVDIPTMGVSDLFRCA